MTALIMAAYNGHAEIVKLLLEAGADVKAGYRTAAQTEYSKALCNLAAMYQKGEGVEKNDKEALKCYRLAAEQNYKPAQLALFFMYKNGEGADVNNTEAYKWLLIAEANGLGTDSLKEQMQELLTAEQMQQAQQEADDFIRKFEKGEDFP